MIDNRNPSPRPIYYDPISVWQAGVRGALYSFGACVIFFFWVSNIGFVANLNGDVQLLIGTGIVALPTILATIWYALRGSKKHKLSQNIAVAIISISMPTALSLWAYSSVLSLHNTSFWSFSWNGLGIIMLFFAVAYMSATILAVIVWAIFSKNQSLS